MEEGWRLPWLMFTLASVAQTSSPTCFLSVIQERDLVSSTFIQRLLNQFRIARMVSSKLTFTSYKLRR